MENWKVVMLGDGGIGKTALAIQFSSQCFSYDPIIEDLYRKHLTKDTAGQKEYANLYDQWVREGQGFILHQKPIFMLVANKCDLIHNYEVSCREDIALAQKFGCKFLKTFARIAYNIEPLFTNIVQVLRPTKQILAIANSMMLMENAEDC
ncbi:ras protein [Suillus fuscotomentosus]|uniref:Ras protein n=1 Tax=Suillus fuscotomentosus TaxID=1912939 RepID=A0AAD4HPX9_9AGAM|nr:ras protein [Suillus fuscotomentosus]KAG1905760.1 ras protein [Suillus fuscotomentosus]